jgi:hypothetical protein
MVATAAGCTVAIEKITCCSDTGSELADELSNGRYLAFQRKLPANWPVNTEPAWIPPSILAWIAKPAADKRLGDSILRDIQNHRR